MTFIEQIKAELAAGRTDDRRIEKLIKEAERLQADNDRLQAELLSLRVMVDRLAQAQRIVITAHGVWPGE